MAQTWIAYTIEKLPELWLRMGEHVVLTCVATAMAVLAGIPLGILASKARSLRGLVLAAAGILQTIPSLAMLVILLALLQKIGTLPAVVALTLYALLPIVRNTLTGLEGVPRETLEAARGIGMTKRQELWMVKMPLAMPVIVAGIRTAAVVSVGIATLSAFIGAGGLGQFINRGLALSNTRLILLGAIPSGLLALAVDFAIAAAAWGMRPNRQSDKGTVKERLKPLALALPLVVVCLGPLAYWTAPRADSRGAAVETAKTGIIRVGSKNFTEQIILAEMLAQLIEQHQELTVDRLLNLGGTMICHGALVRGEIDLYPEYTGTALTAILGQAPTSEPAEVLQIVTGAYTRNFDLVWLPPFGFNNTYTITVRREDADRRGWRNISDLANSATGLRAGFTAEFAERPDGYPGLRRIYGFAFGDVRDIDPAFMYQAMAKREIDVTCAFATDGRISAFNLKPLEDDRGFFPPYQAAPVIRGEILRRYPNLRRTLEPLAGILTNSAMQQLNYQVDQNKESPQNVVRDFLIRRNLIR